MRDRALEGASIVVAGATGATGGIGRQIARQLAERGARLTLTARDPGSLIETDDIVIEEVFLTNVLGAPWLIRAGLEPNAVASRIIAAIEAGEREIPADAFGT